MGKIDKKTEEEKPERAKTLFFTNKKSVMAFSLKEANNLLKSK